MPLTGRDKPQVGELKVVLIGVTGFVFLAKSNVNQLMFFFSGNCVTFAETLLFTFSFLHNCPGANLWQGVV